MFEPGLHPVHRTVFLTGVLAYASAPLWLGFLLISTLLFASHAHDVPKYFIEPYQLFPIWPTANVKLMLTLFGLTALLLLAPKGLSLIVIVLRRQAGQFGGVARLMIGALLEFLHSLLLAPVRMLFHSQFVLAALTGLKLDWKSPPRGDTRTGWGEAVRRHGVHSVLAIAWLGAILATGAAFPWWLSPVIFGILAAIPLSIWGSHSEPGQWLRRRGVFLIPEEVHEPFELSEARRHAEAFDGEASFVDAVDDAELHQQVIDALPERAAASGAKERARAVLIAQAVSDGPQSLDGAQRHRLLSDADALNAVREQVLHRQAHPAWWTREASSSAHAKARAARNDLRAASGVVAGQ
jgi:membrane glycosyltransferase